jgi:hypothetical protein
MYLIFRFQTDKPVLIINGEQSVINLNLKKI